MGSSVHWEKEKVESFSRGTLSGWGGEERERSKRAERRKMDVAQIAVQGFFHDPPLGKLKMFIFFHMGISLMCSMFEPDVSAVSVKASSHSPPCPALRS